MVPLEQDRQAPQVAIPDGLHQATVACFVHNRNTGSVTKGYGALFGYSVARFFSSATEEPMNRRTEEPFSPDPAGRGGDHPPNLGRGLPFSASISAMTASRTPPLSAAFSPRVSFPLR